MTTVVSPRPSISTTTSESSQRNAVDTAFRSPVSAAPANARRHRAALRDYYGLKSAAPVSAGIGTQGDAGKESELDKEGFNAKEHVKRLLETESLEGVLRVEAGLVNEIRGLDGERKALVYDNYSKLIAATDTIRNMRTKMEPLTLTTSTLPPTISHIAELSSSLSTTLHEGTSAQSNGEHRTSSMHRTREEIQRQTVRWVLGAPARLRTMIGDGRRDEAEREWVEVSKLLEEWASVRGAQEVKAQCEHIMKDG